MLFKNSGQSFWFCHLSIPPQVPTLKRICYGVLVVSALAWPGCQGLGLRSQNDMTFLDDEDDDWYYPSPSASKAPQSKVPRPNLADLGSKMGRDGRVRAGSNGDASQSRYNNQNSRNQDSQANNRNGADRDSEMVAYGNSASSSNDRNFTADAVLLETNQPDIDVEGALESLPPAYRDILRKQLEVVQQKNLKNGSQETQAMVAKSPVAETTSAVAEPVEQNQVVANSPNRAPIINASNSVATTATAPKSGVSIHMNDNEPVPSNIEARLAEALQSESKVLQASASSQTSPSSPVTLASATAPVLSASLTTAPSATAPSATAPSATAPSATAPSATAPSSVTASNPLSATTWKQGVGQAIELLEKQIKETPTSDENLLFSQEMTLRMLYVSQRRLEEALRPIGLLSGNESEQQFVHHQMLAMYEASNPDAMPVRSRHWSLVMNSQREATHHLAAASNLEVKSVAFCTEVERYGVVTKFPKPQFQADQGVLLYCEIENVAAEKVRNGFETQLQGSYEIMDSQGRKIADQLLPMEPELCQNHRRDYFIVYKIYMPPQIATGSYQLRLTVEDMKARKFGQSQIDFTIKK